MYSAKRHADGKHNSMTKENMEKNHSLQMNARIWDDAVGKKDL